MKICCIHYNCITFVITISHKSWTCCIHDNCGAFIEYVDFFTCLIWNFVVRVEISNIFIIFICKKILAYLVVDKTYPMVLIFRISYLMRMLQLSDILGCIMFYILEFVQEWCSWSFSWDLRPSANKALVCHLLCSSCHWVDWQ